MRLEKSGSVLLEAWSSSLRRWNKADLDNAETRTWFLRNLTMEDIFRNFLRSESSDVSKIHFLMIFVIYLSIRFDFFGLNTSQVST